MRSSFRGYYPPTQEELTDLWQQALVALDANALLNLYRYSRKTRSEFTDILRLISPRLWLPHQAALEYHHKRIDVIIEQHNVYSSLRDDIQKSRAVLEQAIQPLSRHPVLSKSALLSKLNSLFTELATYIDQREATHPDLPKEHAPGFVDTIRDTLAELFENRVGEPYTDERLSEIYEEGAERYKKSIPPGYMDASKGGTESFGDLIIWNQLIDKARKDHQSIIFVTDDRKEDWWLRVQGKTIGPRPELINEMLQSAGVLFHMYRPEQFMAWSREFLKQEVSDEVIDEVRHVGTRPELQRRVREVAARIAHTTARVDDLRGRLGRQERAWLASATRLKSMEESARYRKAERSRLIATASEIAHLRSLLEPTADQSERLRLEQRLEPLLKRQQNILMEEDLFSQGLLDIATSLRNDPTLASSAASLESLTRELAAAEAQLATLHGELADAQERLDATSGADVEGAGG